MKAVRLGSTTSEFWDTDVSAPHSECAETSQQDRRRSHRVLLERPFISIGPPEGAPTAKVRARDLSLGGVFVEAQSPIEPGTRFCLELNLGPVVCYVAIVEAIDNRIFPGFQGFGARFIKITHASRRAIANYLAKSLAGRELHDSEISFSEKPTLAPAQSSVLDPEEFQGLDSVDSVLQPELVSDDELPAVVQKRSKRVRAAPCDTSGAVNAAKRERTWNVPVQNQNNVSQLLVMAGCLGAATLLVLSVYLTSHENSRNKEEKSGERTTVTASTHKVLMGIEQHDEVWALGQAGKKDRSKKVQIVEPLPPLVDIDALAQTSKRGQRPAKPVKKQSNKRKVQEVEPLEVKSRIVERPKKPKPYRPKKRLGWLTKGQELELRVAVPDYARLRRSYVLHNPERLVVDIEGLDDIPQMPKVKGYVSKIRVGKHPGYVRIVFDLNKKVSEGTARVTNGVLYTAIIP